MANNRKLLNKIMAAVMVVVVLSMIMALFGSSLLSQNSAAQTQAPAGTGK